MKNIYINGIHYELVSKTLGERIIDELEGAYYKGLFDCHKAVSQYNIIAFEAWEDAARDLAIIKNCGVLTFNSQMFTYGFIFNYDGHRAYAKITHTHNYIYIV